MADERGQEPGGRAITQAVETNVAGSLSIGTTNTAAARKRQLQNAIADVDAAVRARTMGQIQNDLKRALEAIHELEDCRRGGEWSQAGWDVRALGLWHAHLGARNAAHHESSGIFSLPGQPGQPLVWAIPAHRVQEQEAEQGAGIASTALPARRSARPPLAARDGKPHLIGNPLTARPGRERRGAASDPSRVGTPRPRPETAVNAVLGAHAVSAVPLFVQSDSVGS